MNKLEQFKALFPLKGTLTTENITNAIRRSPSLCAGALTLKQALGENINFIDNPNNIWSVTSGWMYVDGERVTISTAENIDFVDEKEPKDVTFIVINNK